MDINPIIPLPWLVLVAIGLLPLNTILAWHASRLCTIPRRIVITTARLLGVCGLLLLVLNPGHWKRHLETFKGEWALLLDHSGSMETTDANNRGSRLKRAQALAQQALTVPGVADTAAVFAFADTVKRIKPDAVGALQPEGNSTRITESCRRLLERYQGDGRVLTGILLLSDGRQVPTSDAGAVAALARARQVPIHTMTLGGKRPKRDISIRFRRDRAVAFKNQESRLTVDIKTSGLPPLRTDVILADRDANPIDTRQIELPAGATNVTVSFSLAPTTIGYTPYTVTIAKQADEQNIQNNSDRAALLVLDQPIRILAIEGLPHWDSKFLLQLLHRQPNVEVTSLYRLTTERFFRVEPGHLQAEEGQNSDFPATIEALTNYDLIVFGKGTEYFLTPDRIALLRRFVSDHGGGVLFARGKPYTRDFPELAALEPLVWGDRTGIDGRLQPTADGEETGLFGDKVPGRDDPVWKQLPPLRDMHRAQRLSPFTRILAETTAEGAARLPLILSRRLGQGIIVTVNAGDFWKWDFFPEESESHEMYTAIWSQLLQWMITYAEFLPGESAALRISPPSVLPGDPVRAIVNRRDDGNQQADVLLRVVTDDDQTVLDVMASGRRAGRHDAVFSVTQPGDYHVQAVHPETRKQMAPPVALRVRPLAAEGDNLDADPAFMQQLAEQSGGTVTTADALRSTVTTIQPENRLIPLEQAVWKPIWNRAIILLLIAIVISLEWIARRRGGLS